MLGILDYLTDRLEEENCASAALAHIAEKYCRGEADIPHLLPLHVWRVVNMHGENPLVAENGLAILAHCTVVGKMHAREVRKINASQCPTDAGYLEKLIDCSTYWNANTLAIIYKLMETHRDVIGVQCNGFVFLETILYPSTCMSLQPSVEKEYWKHHFRLFEKICSMGFDKMLMSALGKVHAGVPKLIQPALALLWKLCIDSKY